LAEVEASLAQLDVETSPMVTEKRYDYGAKIVGRGTVFAVRFKAFLDRQFCNRVMRD
jgi:hypothetical protein